MVTMITMISAIRKRSRRLLGTLMPVCAAMLTLAMSSSTSAQVVIYVNDNGLLGGTGDTWGTAYRFLQDALDEAEGIFIPVEIRVAQGIYRPDERIATPVGSGDRSETFHLHDEVTVRGGFRGLPIAPGESPDDRNVAQFPTILSGDLFLNDEPPFNLGDNSVHVVTGSGAAATAVLDGCTVTSGFSESNGAGLINEFGNPTIIDCTFTACVAMNNGGAIANSFGASPMISGCTFTGNSATGSPSGAFGGAIANLSASAPIIDDCTIQDNDADSAGGGIYNGANVDATITASNISSNVAGTAGGGIFTEFVATLNLAGTTVCGNTPDNLSGPMDDGGGNTICGGPCIQDISNNGDVDFADIFEVISNWGPCVGCPEDISGNGDVDFADIFEIIGNWGPCP